MSQNTQKPKKGIDLFVLLISENKKGVCDMLAKHGIDKSEIEDASDKELWDMLHQLYFYHPAIDKQDFEKQMAGMHPHANWIMRVMAPKKPEIEVMPAENKGSPKEEVKQESMQKSSFSGEQKSPCDGCQGCRMSSFDGRYFQASGPQTTSQEDKTHNMMTLISLVAVIGLTYYFIRKNPA